MVCVDQWASVKSIICENQPIVFFLVESKWPAVHRLHNICQHTFASLTIFFIMSTQQQHSKIYLCRLAIPDNFCCTIYCYVNPMLFQQEIMSDEIHLRMVSIARFPFPGGHFTWFYCTGSVRCPWINSQKTEAIN